MSSSLLLGGLGISSGFGLIVTFWPVCGLPDELFLEIMLLLVTTVVDNNIII